MRASKKTRKVEERQRKKEDKTRGERKARERGVRKQARKQVNKQSSQSNEGRAKAEITEAKPHNFHISSETRKN